MERSASSGHGRLDEKGGRAPATQGGPGERRTSKKVPNPAVQSLPTATVFSPVSRAPSPYALTAFHAVYATLLISRPELQLAPQPGAPFAFALRSFAALYSSLSLFTIAR
jgi:hypothetical protein